MTNPRMVDLILTEYDLILLFKAIRHYNMPNTKNTQQLKDLLHQIRSVAESENIQLD